MLKVDPTVQTLTVAGIIAISLSVLINGTLSSQAQNNPAGQAAVSESGASLKGRGRPRRRDGWSRRTARSASWRRPGRDCRGAGKDRRQGAVGRSAGSSR